MVNDFDSSFGYCNLCIYKFVICEFLQGENVWSYVEKLKLAIFSICDYMFFEFIFCDDVKFNEIEENIWIVCNIRYVMEIGELFFVYQSIVDINICVILGVEVLCCWVFVEWGIILSLKFIIIVEDIGFINELGYQIIKMVMGEFRYFSQCVSLKDDFLLYINVSFWQLNELYFYECFIIIMKENGLKVNSFCVEIIEIVIE